MKKIDFKKPETQLTTGIISVIVSIFLYFIVPLLLIMPIYSITGQSDIENLSNRGGAALVGRLHFFEILIHSSQIAASLFFLGGISLIVGGFIRRSKS